MWSYHGRKSKTVHLYPVPKYDTIIEPFAGTACYSLHENNWTKNVILRDVNPQIIRLWKWLQNDATVEKIMDLPSPERGKLPDIEPVEAKWLVAFWSNRGSAAPRKSASRLCTFTHKKKVETAGNLHKIKHWDIQFGSYEAIPNIKATWFIDPPYKGAANYYKYCEDLDYGKLGEWCETRRGQAIVCGGEKDEWLPFEPLCKANSQNNTRYLERVYVNRSV